ncbi:MAG: polyphosphate kinase 1 [Lachnospiraceae bacterium]|nr:polyphosphate kinase 1 [Lachnospiraceae bacterium]
MSVDVSEHIIKAATRDAIEEAALESIFDSEDEEDDSEEEEDSEEEDDSEDEDVDDSDEDESEVLNNDAASDADETPKADKVSDIDRESDSDDIIKPRKDKKKKYKKKSKKKKKNSGKAFGDAKIKADPWFTNRELSWLQFNERVLNEAGNPRVPLAERLMFASIYQTNLDEFFRVRVGTLMMQVNSGEKVRDNKTKMTAREQVDEILNQVKILEKKKAYLYEQLLGELEPKSIRIINFNKLSKKEGDFLEQYFDVHIAPFLSPMLIGRQQPFPFLTNGELYAIVLLATPKGKKKMGIVQCSNRVFKRLIEIPTRPGCAMLSEELILHFVSKLYPQYVIREKSILRVTRNADIDAHDVYDEDMDYRNMMEQLIKMRKRMDPVRVELSRQINDKAKSEIAKYLDMGVNHIINVETPLDLSFVFDIQKYIRNQTELFYTRLNPQLSPELVLRDNILDQVEKKDVLLSYPYESMRPFLKLLSDAAADPDVTSIKMTLYRVADKSQIVDILIDAAENGKEVVVLCELRARFDEENNIEMSHRLEDAGCRILYGLGDYKVHSKLCLITKRKDDGYEYITQIGTGNYNEKTSRLYTDLSLITTNQDIGKDAAAVFTALQKGEVVEETNELLVAPRCFQSKILEMIDGEIKKQQEGRPAYIGVKINSLTDKDIIDKLIEASQAGVKIELIVRGICCLKPQVPGVTENIRIISVVGRYLEHSRIFRFGAGEEEVIYISSADFMTRNTVRRVEVAAPVHDERAKEKIKHIFNLLLMDDEKGKEQGPDGIYRDRRVNETPLNAQEVLYKEAYERAAREEIL